VFPRPGNTSGAGPSELESLNAETCSEQVEFSKLEHRSFHGGNIGNEELKDICRLSAPFDFAQGLSLSNGFVPFVLFCSTSELVLARLKTGFFLLPIGARFLAAVVGACLQVTDWSGTGVPPVGSTEHGQDARAAQKQSVKPEARERLRILSGRISVFCRRWVESGRAGL
jgi:hypothetical protein